MHEYRHGVLERSLDVGETSGVILPPDWALQVPHDYVEVLQVAVPAAVRDSGIDPRDVIGIGTVANAQVAGSGVRSGVGVVRKAPLNGRPGMEPHASQTSCSLHRKPR